MDPMPNFAQKSVFGQEWGVIGPLTAANGQTPINSVGIQSPISFGRSTDSVTDPPIPATR
jgi:hypothetical protein